MDETTGKFVFCTNAVGYGTGRKYEKVWGTGETDSEGAEGVYCGGKKLKYSDSIKQMEKITEKVNKIPKICEDVNRWNIENPILQTKDYFASSAIAQAETLFSNSAIGLVGKQDDICKNILGNTALGLAATMQVEQTHISFHSALEAIKKYDGLWQNAALSVATAMQAEQTHVSLSPVLEAMKKYEGICQKLVECTNFGSTIQATSQQFNFLQDVTRNNLGLRMESAIKMDGLSHAVTAFAEGLTVFTNSTSYQGVTKFLEQYQNSIGQIISSVQLLPIDKFEEMDHIWEDFNIDDVSISENGDLTYQGMTYERDEVPQAVESQLREIEQNPLPLKHQLEELKQRFWLLFFIVSIALAIPDFMEKINWYADLGKSICEVVLNLPKMGYTIKEKSYIRSEANAKSKILTTLVYDTELEILEDMPRWYRVKYTDETGAEIEGWISKISVEE